MQRRSQSLPSWTRWACGAAALSLCATTGCQVDVNGQTLPSPWYQKDDVQYYAPGPEFKLSKEAAAQREYQDQQDLEARGAEQ